MKQFRAGILSLFLLFYFFHATAQVNFKAIVPQHPIAAGESFQVQYIIENAEKVSDFSPPPFHRFRVVSGPHMYFRRWTGSRKKFSIHAGSDPRRKF